MCDVMVQFSKKNEKLAISVRFADRAAWTCDSAMMTHSHSLPKFLRFIYAVAPLFRNLLCDLSPLIPKNI